MIINNIPCKIPLSTVCLIPAEEGAAGVACWNFRLDSQVRAFRRHYLHGIWRAVSQVNNLTGRSVGRRNIKETVFDDTVAVCIKNIHLFSEDSDPGKVVAGGDLTVLPESHSCVNLAAVSVHDSPNFQIYAGVVSAAYDPAAGHGECTEAYIYAAA